MAIFALLSIICLISGVSPGAPAEPGGGDELAETADAFAWRVASSICSAAAARLALCKLPRLGDRLATLILE